MLAYKKSITPNVESSPQESTREAIKSAVRIEDVAANYTKLSRNGDSTLRGVCPIHFEADNPTSFAVYPETGSWSCFSCEQGGDVLDLIQKVEGIGFREALGKLAAEAGIEVNSHGKRNADQVWEIRDSSGKVQAEHHRYNHPDGGKDVLWKLPGAERWGLQGRKLESLPLFGSERISAEDTWVVLAEGEKAAGALRAVGIPALGTVTGAGGTPSPAALSTVQDLAVVLWPDHDDEGRNHMNRIAEQLQGIASSVQWFEWAEAPAKGDAADHPDPASVKGALLQAPAWEPRKEPENLDPLSKQAMPLAEGIRRGFPPPEELEPGILLKGKSHTIFCEAEKGKSWLALWLAERRVEAGQKVLYMDHKMGHRTVGERLSLMGVATERLDELFRYVPFPELDPDIYAEHLDTFRPELVVFDSLAEFLAAADYDEDSNGDFVRWANSFLASARSREITTLVLDHVGHSGKHTRGASRKRDEADVRWKLHKTREFSRSSVGEIVLHIDKDRESWLPASVTFSIGTGADGQFVCEPSSGTIEEPDPADGLTPTQRRILDLIRSSGEEGTRFTDLQREAGCSKSTASGSVHTLEKSNLAYKDERTGRYHSTEPQKPLI